MTSRRFATVKFSESTLGLHGEIALRHTF